MFQFFKLGLAAVIESVITAMAVTFVCLNVLWFSNGTYGQGIDALGPYGLVIFGALTAVAKLADFAITVWLLSKRGKRFDNATNKFYDSITARDFYGSQFWLEKMDECMYPLTRVLSAMEKWSGLDKAAINSQYWQVIDSVSAARRLRGEIRQSEWK